MHIDKKTLQRLALVLAGAIALNWLLQNLEVAGGVLKAVWAMVFPFTLGLILAYLLNIPVRAIETRLFKDHLPRMRRTLSFIMAAVLILGLVALVIFLLVPQLVNTGQLLVSAMPGYITRIQESLQPWEQYIPQLEEYAKQLDWQNIASSLVSWVQDGAGSFFSSAFSVATSIVSGTTSFVIGLIFACYMLFDKEHLLRQADGLAKAYLRADIYDKVMDVLHTANRVFSGFVTGQCLEAVIVALIYLVALAVGGFDYALLLALVIGVTSIIPMFGAFIGCGIGALLIWVSQGFWRTVAFVILCIVIQQIDGNLVYPRVVGTSVGLPPIWVLAAVTIGGGLFGLSGMIFFIPLTSVIYVLVRRNALNRLQAKGLYKEEAAVAEADKPAKVHKFKWPFGKNKPDKK